MRGTTTAGMALGAHERRLTLVFDDVYGSSAGAIAGAWLCSANPSGLRIWLRRTRIRWSMTWWRPQPTAPVGLPLPSPLVLVPSRPCQRCGWMSTEPYQAHGSSRVAGMWGHPSPVRSGPLV
jgi:predicted acylesterase/phospholipase RssA